MIISVVNQKGGCGKTTTAVNLSACLAARGFRVLLIDLDPQGNASLGLGIDTAGEAGSYQLLVDDACTVDSVIRPTGIYNLDIIPAGIALSGADLDLAGATGRESILKSKLGSLNERYEFSFIDCSPSLSLLTVNALAAADEVLIPLQAHYYALEGMKLLFSSINIVKNRLNYGLSIMGILPTFYDQRMAICREVLTGLRDYFGRRVMKTVIRINSKLTEAPSAREPIHIYAPHSRGAQDYGELAEEVLRFARGQEKIRVE